MTNQLISAIKGTGRVIAETYRLGFKAWVAAPLILAIAVIPELIQHVVEIRLGMFDSMERFQTLAQNPDRWLFGYFKVAGLIIAMLAIARFWSVGSVRKTFTMSRVDLGRLVVAVALTVLAAFLFDWLSARHLPSFVSGTLRIASLLVQAGLSLFVAAALFGDRSVTLRSVFTERWPTIALLALMVLLAFMPAQLLHMLNHKLAIGRSAGVVWLLMIWDSLVVGMIASLLGAALWAAYRSGATWRGWGPDFMPEPGAVAEGAKVEAAVIASPVVPPPPSPEPTLAQSADLAVEAPRRRRPRPGPRRRG